MDNSWQNKCSSTWQSTVMASSAAAAGASSSSQVQPQQPQNHLEMSTGQFLYPHVAQESRSTAQEKVREPTYPNTLNLGSYKSDSVELGNSFLAILSGSSSLLQYDTQQLSNQKPFNTCGKLPINSCCDMNMSARNEVPLTPSWPNSDTLSKQNPRNGPVFGPVFSSSAAMSTNCSSTIGFPHGLSGASFNLQSSDLARAVLNHAVPGNGKVRGNSSLREEWDSATNSDNSAKLHHPNFEALQKMSSEKNSSSSNRPSNFLSGCPRVLCLSICGDLLLSNTGLLGVVCSCHCLHMSISKFCEHSGLYDVNPGDAVHMDNGETIAQWRKLYFQKFGIRVPDDHSGWDWPECFSATAGLVKSSLTMPSIPKNADFYRLIGSPGVSVRSEQARESILLSENSVTDQNHLNDILHSKQQRNGQGSCNVLFKGLAGTSHSNFRAVADNQMSRCSTMASFVDRGGSDNGCQFYQKDNGCQTISAYTNSISKSGNSFISQPTLQNLRIPGTGSNLKKACNLKAAVNLDRDVVSSNIELKLGQPYQQSWTSGNTLLSVVGPKPLDTLIDPPKSVSQDHLIHNKHNFGLAKKCSQYPQWVSSTSDFCLTREQNQSNSMNYALGANNAVDTTKLEQCKEGATKSSVISMLLSHINALSGENVQSRAHNIHNANEHSMHRTEPCESHIARPYPINFPWNSGDGSERQINIKESGLLNKLIDDSKGVRCVTDRSHFTVESDYGFEKRMENSFFSNGVVGGSSNPSITTVNDRNINPCHFSAMPLDASDGINFFNYSGKVPSSGSSGQFNKVFIKSSNLALGAGTGIISPPQAASMCFSSATSTSVPNLTSALPNKEGIGISPYMVDEDSRLLAARHMLELSKQGDTISSPNMKQHGRFGSSSHVIIAGADPLCAEQVHRLTLTNMNNMSEVVPKPPHSSALHRMGGDDAKLAPMAGLKNWSNLSTFMHANPSCSKEVNMQCQSSHDPFSNKHHPLRHGRTESIISSNEHGKSCQRVPFTCFPGNCSCTVQTKCLGGGCNSKLETSMNAFKEQIGSVSCKDLLASNIDTVHKENTISLEKSGNLKEHMPKRINFHSFQWKDVPNKVVRDRNMTHIDPPTNALNGTSCDDNQLEDAAEKCLKRTEQEVSTLKRKEISNISSGCSTPAIIQESIDVTNTDSCTVDESDGRYVNNLVIDEGSANDKCGSSDDVLCSERSAEFLGSTCKSNLIKERSSKALANQSSCNLIDDLKLLDSLRWKKVPNQIQTAPTTYGKSQSNHLQKVEGGPKCWKTDRDIKGKVLDSSLPASGISSVNNGSSKRNGGARWERRSPVCNDEQMILSSDQGTSHSLDAASLEPNLKHKRSSFSSVKTTSRKRDLHRAYNHDTEDEDGYETDQADYLEVPRVSCVKRLRHDWPSDPMKHLWLQKPNCRDSEAGAKFKSVGSTKAICSWRMNSFNRKARPVVYGKYGIISNGKLVPDMSKPAKIVPLSKVLKTARCTLSEICEARSPSMRELKKKRSKVSFEVFDDVSRLKEKDSENHKVTVHNKLDPDNSMEAEKKAGLNKDKEHADELYKLEKERDAGRVKLRSISDSYCGTSSKPKTKEIRKRSLCELIVTGNKSRCSPEKKCTSFGKFSSSAHNTKCQNAEECDVSAKKTSTEHRCESSISNPGAFCCVCGSSNKDVINSLLECSQCLIRVHQACYGVAKVPKGSWYCRPCRTSSTDIACVLCGYGAGAMTRALRSRSIVKSLLKAWNFETEYRTSNEHYSSEAMNDELRILNSAKSEQESGLFPVPPLNIEVSSGAVWKMNIQNQSEIVTNILGSSSKMKNSITVGVLDPTVKQWVHMVCGLWTPGTRCPNVDTMSAFDVSGASHPRASVVCSICNRSGGSLIQCRVVDCSVQFHPWCAHQKGLLQSEVEGVENESVGFYGRCVLHAMCPPTEYSSESNNSETGCPRGKELTCARTEGYKGRKRDGFRHNIYGQSNSNAGCLVPQEQLNAWLHINGQKSCTKGLLKHPVPDIEHDCRKEYARYKYAKGWKHLVVYKSDIHALGLYTSRFIPRGAMVVEYVGEIVGLRVADKRECEYQSGRKLQYKSACYFFRIDKEHIIDATCKGGIARFVNHSCLPNCVAKVISVRNEKKVVFFAERDIYPGEEITYDYHFNHEDEGKKIPCFCNAKNCRRYMN